MNRSYHILGIVILTIGHSYLNEFYWIVLRFSDVGRCTKKSHNSNRTATVRCNKMNGWINPHYRKIWSKQVLLNYTVFWPPNRRKPQWDRVKRWINQSRRGIAVRIHQIEPAHRFIRLQTWETEHQPLANEITSWLGKNPQSQIVDSQVSQYTWCWKFMECWAIYCTRAARDSLVCNVSFKIKCNLIFLQLKKPFVSVLILIKIIGIKALGGAS